MKAAALEENIIQIHQCENQLRGEQASNSVLSQQIKATSDECEAQLEAFVQGRETLTLEIQRKQETLDALTREVCTFQTC